MADVLQFGEYPSEKIFEAQDLYCVDRLTFETVAERTGVSVPTLKRWSDKYGWRAKREELAKLESEIRFNTFKARDKMIKKVIADGGALDAFAVAKLKTMVIDQARFKAEQHEGAPVPPVAFDSPAHAAELLESALSAKLGIILATPSELNLKTLKELREALNLLAEMRGKAAEDASKSTGLSPEVEEKIVAILKGDL